MRNLSIHLKKKNNYITFWEIQIYLIGKIIFASSPVLIIKTINFKLNNVEGREDCVEEEKDEGKQEEKE